MKYKSEALHFTLVLQCYYNNGQKKKRSGHIYEENIQTINGFKAIWMLRVPTCF